MARGVGEGEGPGTRHFGRDLAAPAFDGEVKLAFGGKVVKGAEEGVDIDICEVWLEHWPAFGFERCA